MQKWMRCGPHFEARVDDGVIMPAQHKVVVKKPYAIEFKYVRTALWRFGLWDGNWHIWRRYADEKARDQALKVLQKRAPYYIYRPKEDNGISGRNDGQS
jgi:hypothetical protein